VLRLERVSKIYPTGEVLRDVTWEVKAGDAIPCTSGDSHGLYNNSDKEIELIVFSAAKEKGARNEKDLGDDLTKR